MAILRITDYMLLENGIEKTSWMFTKDPDRQVVIDQSLEDDVNLFQWVSPLPKLQEDYSADELATGKTYYYKDLDTLYGHVRIHSRNLVSEWYTRGPINISIQDLVLVDHQQPIHADEHYYTLGNDPTEETDSLQLHWTTNPHDEQVRKLASIPHRDISYNQLINIHMSRTLGHKLHGIAKLIFTPTRMEMYLYDYELDREDLEIIHPDRLDISISGDKTVVFKKIGSLETQVICRKINCLFVILFRNDAESLEQTGRCLNS